MNKNKEENRNRLRKVLGKRKKFEAEVELVTEDKILFINVTLDNKRVAHHLWVDKPNVSDIMEKGCFVVFTAIAVSYTDTMKIYKYGLASVHSLSIKCDILENVKKKNKHDGENAQYRRKRRK